MATLGLLGTRASSLSIHHIFAGRARPSEARIDDAVDMSVASLAYDDDSIAIILVKVVTTASQEG